MRTIVLCIIVLVISFSCREVINNNDKEQIMQWSIHKRKQDTVYLRVDTLPLNKSFIQLEQLGRIEKSIIDTILGKGIINQEYRLDSLIIWLNPVIKQEQEGKIIELYNIFISDIKNGGEMNFVYTKDYGVLMQIYDPFNILALDKLQELNRGGSVTREVSFTKLQSRLMNDTIIFPLVKSPPPPFLQE